MAKVQRNFGTIQSNENLVKGQLIYENAAERQNPYFISQKKNERDPQN